MNTETPTIVNFVDEPLRAIHLDGNNVAFDEAIDYVDTKYEIRSRQEDNTLLNELQHPNVALIRSATKLREGGSLSPKELQATSLLYVIRTGVGVDNLDIPALAESGIIVTNTPRATTESVGEHTVGLAFSLLKKFAIDHGNTRKKDFKKSSTEELKGKRVLVIGSGNIGADTGAKFSAMGAEVEFFDPYAKALFFAPTGPVGRLGNARSEHSPGALPIERERAQLQALMAEADIITLHVPDQKAPIIGVAELEFLAANGKNPYIINTSRPSAVDTEALLAHLVSGNLRGLGLDVFPQEKAAFFESPVGKKVQEILGEENLQISHHSAGNSQEGQSNTGTEAAGYAINLRRGKVKGFGVEVSQSIPADHVRLSFINKNISGALNAVMTVLATAGLNVTVANTTKTPMFGGADSPVDFHALDIRNGEMTPEQLGQKVSELVGSIADNPIIKGWISAA